MQTNVNLYLISLRSFMPAMRPQSSHPEIVDATGVTIGRLFADVDYTLLLLVLEEPEDQGAKNQPKKDEQRENQRFQLKVD